MAGGAYSAMSGMQARLAELDRIAADLANISTAGYKTERTATYAAERDFAAFDAAHEAAHAEASLARQTHERTRELSVRGLVSPEQREQAESRLASAEAALRAAESRRAAAEALVRLQRDEVAHLVVRAPFDGIIARRLVEVGESVVPGERVLGPRTCLSRHPRTVASRQEPDAPG